jgi:aminopeptidase N
MLVGTRTVDRPGRAPLLVTALVQPEHAETLDRHLDDAVASVAWFERNVGEYPYATLTVVDPAPGADGAGGMEYPTFITAGEAGTGTHEDDAGLEVVIFHEFGHQYWYGMVASNEFEEPWMDEGINSYSESLGLDEIWSAKNSVYFPVAPLSVKLPIPSPYFRGAQRFAALPQFVEPDPIVRTSWGFSSNLSYGLNCYPRTAITLRTLRGYLGAETMDRVMRTYFERWRFRHPTAQDFFDVASEVSGRDLSWFFDEFFRASRPLDYAVGSVARSNAGTDSVTLERRGEAVLPVKARVTREDGTVEDLVWDGQDALKTFDLDGTSPIARVEIDPDHVVSLDADITNNSRLASAELAGPFRIASDWGLLFEHVLALLGGCV